MATLPSSLSLAVIADGSAIVAADHRTNYAAVQTEANALLTILGGGTSAQFLQSGGGTTVSWAGAYSAYTPTWTATGVAPVIGNATVVARYLQVGKLVHAYGSIVFGGTSTYGTGQYIFALPVAPSASVSSPMTIGTAQLTDTSATAKASVNIEFFAASTVWLVYPATWPSGTSTAVAQTAPWTWAAGDTIAWNLIYEAA